MALPPHPSRGRNKAALGTAFAAGTLVCCAAVAAISRSQLGKNAFQAPPAEPVPFAAPPPPSAPGTPAVFEGYPGQTAPIPGAPVSRVRQDETGSSDSTRAVNLITTAAPMGSEGSDAWLGTQYGVKRVQGKNTRYYTTSDGLPGDYVEAVAADQSGEEAFCLVRTSISPSNASRPQIYDGGSRTQAGPPLVFCAWDKKTDTWHTVQEITAPPTMRNYNGYSSNAIRATWDLEGWVGKSLIKNSPQFVCFASGVVAPKADALAYIWDKKNGKIRPIPWKPGLQESEEAGLGISFLHMDETNQTLWLGTSRGLLAYHLPDGTWRSVLSDRLVGAGAMADDTALFVTARLADDALPPRPTRPGMGGGVMVGNVPPRSGETPIWRLYRIDLPSGETTEMPAPPSTGSPYGWPGYSGGFSEAVPNEPSGLFVDDKKNVWATIVPPANPFYGGAAAAGGIDRFDTAQKTWQHIALAPPFDPRRGRTITRRGPDGAPLRTPPGTNTPPVAAPTPDPILVLLDTVPNGALVPLTLSDNRRGSDPFYRDDAFGYGYPGNATAHPAYWIRHRFPAWYGPSDEEAQAADNPYNGPPLVSGGSPSEGDRVWELQSDTLLSFPRADLGPNGFRAAPRDPSHTETYPFKATISTLRAGVVRMVSAATPQNPALILAQDNGSTFLVDTNKNTWSEIVLPDKSNGSTSVSSSTMVANVSQPSSPLLQKTNSGEQQVRQWNPAAKTFETDAIPVPKNSRLLGAGASGAAWFVSYNGSETLWYQKPAAPGSAVPEPIQVAPTLPGEWASPQNGSGMRSLPRPISVEGSRAWYHVRVRADFFEPADENNSRSYSDRESLAGYDVLTQKWTFPLPLPRNTSDKVALLTRQNRTFAATTAGNPNGSVWEWSEPTRTWLVVAPPLPPEPGLFESDDYPLHRPVVPVAVDDKYVWVLVLGRMMARYDRTRQQWQSFPLPPALRDKPETFHDSDRQPKALQTGPNSFCVGSEKGGLWRLRVGAASGATMWEPVGRQLVLQSRPQNGGKIPEFYLSHLTVTPHYVWMLGSHQAQRFAFAARFDKAAKTWTVLDDRSGFPVHDNFDDVAADGDSVWVTGGSGTYRFDPKTNRWTLMLRGNDSSARIPENAIVSPLVKSRNGPIGSVQKMATDDKSVYLLFRVPPQTRNATQANRFATILWRWDKATQTLLPLTLPGAEGTPTHRITPVGNVLLNEPDTLWVGTDGGLFAWDKTKQQGREIAFPPSIPFVAPQRIVRKGDALVLTGSNLVRDAGGSYSYSGIPHVIRLMGPDFLKRP